MEWAPQNIVQQGTEPDATPAATERRNNPTSSSSRVMKVHPSWNALTTGGAGTKLLRLAEHKPFADRVLSTRDSEDDSSGVVTVEGDSHYGGFRIGSDAELGSGVGCPGIARAKRGGCGEDPGGVFVGSGPRKAGETVSVGAEGRPEQRAYALVQLSTRSGLDSSDPRAALCMRLLGSFETEAQATRRVYNLFYSVFCGKPVCWRSLHRTEEDDPSVPGRSTVDLVFLLRKGVPVQWASLAMRDDGRRRGSGYRRPGSGGDRVRDGDGDFGRGYDLDFPTVFKRKGERFALAFVQSAEQLKELRNDDQGWDETQLQQRQTRKLAEERATQDAPSALSSGEGENRPTVLTEVHANGQYSLHPERTSSVPPCVGCTSRPKDYMDAGCGASDSAVREGLALPECQTTGAWETAKNPHELDAFKTSSAGAEEASSRRRISGLVPPETLGDETLHVAADRSMKREHCSTVDSSEGGSEGKNAIRGHHPLEANGLDCRPSGVRVAHLREPCSEVFPSRRSGSSEGTTGACFPDRKMREYSPVSRPDNACKTAPRGVESGMTCQWWKTDGLFFLEKVEGYYETEDLASRKAKHRRGRLDGEARSGCSAPRPSWRTTTQGSQIGGRHYACILPVYRWFSLGDGTMSGSHRAVLGYSLSDREATMASSLAISEAPSAEGMNKRIRATMHLRMENNRPRTAGSGRDPGQRGIDHLFDLFSQDASRHKGPSSPLGDAAARVYGPIEDVLGESDGLLRVQDTGSSSVCGDTDHWEGVSREKMGKAAWGAIRRARSAVLSKNQKLIETELKARRRATTNPSAADHDDSSRSSASCWSPRGRLLTGQGRDDHETLLLSRSAVTSTPPPAWNQECCASAPVDSMVGPKPRPWAVVTSGPGEAGESRECLRAQMYIERQRARLFEDIRGLPYKTTLSTAASKGGGKVARSVAKKRVADIGNATDKPTRVLGLRRAAEIRAQARLHGKPPTPFVRPRSVKAPAGRVCPPPLSPSPSPKSSSSNKAEE